MASPRSHRFLPSSGGSRSRRPRSLWGPVEMFVEGPWLSIRLLLERQGWRLEMAGHNVAMLSGSCPLESRHEA
jgi:hypothetical protein